MLSGKIQVGRSIIPQEVEDWYTMPLPKKIPRSRAKSDKTPDKRILANRYRVEKKLGSGNFGTAWLVTDLKCKDPKDQL